ncbi:MAG TPA: hypothetical protein VD963_05685, partial [Phycisphaerales bacterium]|nr:hypothetical protein [Phycisphaerales bacterium]
MSIAKSLVAAAVLAGLAGAAHGSVVVDYTVDAGGTSVGPLNGLQARATFTISGTTLTIRMQNTSTGTPADFDLGSSFLVSLGFDLPAGLVI